MDEVEVDKRNVIFKSLESVINFDINMSDLKDFLYLSLDMLNQTQCVVFTLHRVL